MSKIISKDDAYQAVAKITHPEIARTLEELGMIKDVKVENDVVTITMALPIPTVPIQDYLAQIVTDAVLELESKLKIKVKFVEMNPEERANFFKMSRKGWMGVA